MFKCIITGLGGRGQYWLTHLLSRKDVQLAAAVEPLEASAAKAADRFGLSRAIIYSSLDDALDRVRADFVLDVTPPAVHHVIAEKAFTAGLHVLGEKPLSDNFATAQKVVEMGNKAGVKHMITQNYRFGAFPRTTRGLIAQDLIGAPGQCDIRFYMPWADLPGTHYVEQPYMLINDMMVHHFDLMRYVLGVEPISVQAITWNQPWGWHTGDAAHAIVFEFAGGLRATHVALGCAIGWQTSWNGDWVIQGPHGSIIWDKDRMWHTHLHRTDKPLHEEIFPLRVPPAEQAMLDEFFAAITDHREPECSARDNLHSLAMVFGAIESARENRKVILDAVK